MFGFSDLDSFSLTNTISPLLDTEPEDVLRTKTALGRLGHLDTRKGDLSSFPDKSLFDGVKRFQKQQGLKIDGVMKPHGPTARRITKVLGGETQRPDRKSGKALGPAPASEDRFVAEDHPTSTRPSRSTGPSRTTPWFVAGNWPDLKDEDSASNGRTIDGLLSYTVNGDLPKLFAETLENRSDKPVSEFADFLRQLFERKPERANAFEQQVLARMPAQTRNRFQTIIDGVSSPIGTKEIRDRTAINAHPRPMLHRPGWTYENGHWREQTPAEKARSGIQLLRGGGATSGEGGSGATGSDTGSVTGSSPDQDSDKSDRARLLDEGADLGEALGMDRSSGYLKHFLEGNGETLTMSRDEARQDPFIHDAETQNRQRFEEQTFIGDTERNHDLNKALLNLKDGETYSGTDKWTVDQTDENSLLNAAKRFGRGGVDDYLSFGRQKLISRSEFTATRKGGIIHIEGQVRHDGGDTYDFHDGRTGELSGAKGLQDSGEGTPFDIERDWTQTFTGTVKVTGTGDGGKLILGEPDFVWKDVE